MTFGQMRIGLLGMRRRIADYDPAQGFPGHQLHCDHRWFPDRGLDLIFFINLFLSVRKVSPHRNLWESRSPEWQFPSPAPIIITRMPESGGEPYDYGLEASM